MALVPWKEWSQCFDERWKFPKRLRQRLDDEGFTNADPTRYQALAWPVLMHKKDIVLRTARAWNRMTTIEGDQLALTYAVPGCVRALQSEKDSPSTYLNACMIAMLILAPTWRRCEQIRSLVQRIVPTRLSYKVCTPDELRDELRRGAINLRALSYFVIEGADVMLDTDWESISEGFPMYTNDRQTVLVTVRMRNIRHMEREFMGDHTIIQCGRASGPEDPWTVVVNGLNVGHKYGKMKGTGFDYESVRRCVNYFNDHHFKVILVMLENFECTDNGRDVHDIPEDIRKSCKYIAEAPRLLGDSQASVDDEMTIHLAYNRKCYFLDNDNYRDWQETMRPEEVRSWLVDNQDTYRVGFFFDPEFLSFHTFHGFL